MAVYYQIHSKRVLFALLIILLPCSHGENYNAFEDEAEIGNKPVDILSENEDDEPSENEGDEPSENEDDEPSENEDDEPSENEDDEPSENEDDEPSENEGDEPSENEFLRIEDEYQADFGPWRVTPTPGIDFGYISKSAAPTLSTNTRRIKATPSEVFPFTQQTPTPQTRFVFRTTRSVTRYRTTRRPWSRFTSKRPSTSRPQSVRR